MIATMKDMDKVRSDKYKVLAQRCIPLKFTLTPEELDEILQGKPFYQYHKYDVPEDGVINRREYREILTIAKQFRAAHRNFQAEYARAVGDLCRIAAVLDEVDHPISQLVCYLKLGYRLDQARQVGDLLSPREPSNEPSKYLF
jgi:hypothetical protein